MTEIVVALIGATAVVGAAWLGIRRPMKNEHAANQSALSKIHASVGEVKGIAQATQAQTQHIADRLDDHLNDHANGSYVRGD